MEEEKSKTILFGQNVSEMPCFRQTFLYSIGSGLGMGLLHFLATSRVQRSAHVGMITYGTVTLVYWSYCRYNFSKEKFNMSKLQSAMQKATVYEGTEVEKKILEEAK